MVERVGRYIEQWNMIHPGDLVLIGVSGGADSVCLCLLLRELSVRGGFSVRVVHVEHGIRGEESRRDAAFVEELCRGLGLSFALHTVDVPAYAAECRIGEEEAARNLRYGAFAREAERQRKESKGCGQTRCVRIALAHHMEDNAETILFRMARGTGPDGLCGMAPVRTDGSGNFFIRPLLAESREAIERFLAERGQTFCQDATNGELTYSRNRIRHRVMPELSGVNVQAVLHINRMALQMRELCSYVDGQTAQIYSETVQCRTEDGAMEWFVSEKRLSALPQVIGNRVICRAVAEAAGKKRDIASVHIESVRQLFSLQCGRSVDLPHGVRACRVYGGVSLRGGRPAPEHGLQCTVSAAMLEACAKHSAVITTGCSASGARISLRTFSYEGNPSQISTKMYTKWFDYDKIKDGFSIRSRRSGDYFVMDESGRRKKLERYFIDQKVPLSQRAHIPVLARDAEVLWVIGKRMGHSGMVTESTRTVLEITYEGGAEDGLQQEAQNNGL